MTPSAADRRVMPGPQPTTHDAPTTDAVVVPLPAPRRVPVRATRALAAAGGTWAVVVDGASPLLLVALVGLLVALGGGTRRRALVLPGVVALHGAVQAVAAGVGPDVATATGLQPGEALLVSLLAVALAEDDHALGQRAAVAAGLLALLDLTLLGFDVLGASLVGAGTAVCLLTLVLADEVLARRLSRPGDPGPWARLGVVGLVLLPAGAVELVGTVAPAVRPAVTYAVAALLSLAVLLAGAARYHTRMRGRVEDLEELTAMFVEGRDRGVLAVGLDGVVLAANPAADRILGGGGRSVVGTDVESFLPLGRARSHAARRSAFLAGTGTRPMRASGPVRARALDGREVVLRIALRRVSGRTERVLALLEDLTAERREADELREQLRRQEAVVAQLHRLESLRTGLLTAASHELRTPVTVIHGTAELLASRHEQLDATTTGALLDRQLGQSQRLVRLLEDLVSVDPDGDVTTHPRAVPLDRTVAATVERWARPHDDVPVTVLGHPATAWVDPSSLERILAILLDNAVRHGALPIAVQVRGHEGGPMLTVSDSGPGIPADLLEEVFLPFGRGTSVDEANPGLGLGLPLARLLAETDGGSLRAAAVATGAQLELLLPRPPAGVAVGDSIVGDAHPVLPRFGGRAHRRVGDGPAARSGSASLSGSAADAPAAAGRHGGPAAGPRP